jgi:hypothetical protein
MNEHNQSVLGDPSVSYFTKTIIREGLKKYPVDAVAYVELALLVLKEELLAKVYKLEPWRRTYRQPSPVGPAAKASSYLGNIPLLHPENRLPHLFTIALIKNSVVKSRDKT